MVTGYLTDWASPPGATIHDALNAKSIGLSYFAELIGQDEPMVRRLLVGDIAINYDLAILLADVLGASPRFWMNREAEYRADLLVARLPSNDMKKEWLSKFPIGDMVRFGWMPAARTLEERFRNCLDFFGISSPSEWDDHYLPTLQLTAFRTSEAFREHYPATAAWLRSGEIAAAYMDCANWDKAKFEAALPSIRQLTRTKDPKVFLPKLQALCAECGVAVVISPSPSGSHASGATRFLTPQKALIVLSFRYRSDDQFWFTFFHEAAHLILHDSSRVFIENGNADEDRDEIEANQFSQEILIPRDLYALLPSVRRNFKAIIQFAGRVGVCPGIVVGQMQHEGLVDVRRFSFLKRRFDWAEIFSNDYPLK